MKIIIYLVIFIIAILEAHMKRVSISNKIINLHKPHNKEFNRKTQRPIKLQNHQKNERNFVKDQLRYANTEIKKQLANGHNVNKPRRNS